MKKALAALAVLAALPCAAEVETYTIDSRHTFPAFEVGHLGLSLQRGRFNKTTGKVTLDAAAGKGTIEITIDAASLDTGLDSLEQKLRGEEFFDVAKHPSIVFKSSSVTFDGERVKAADGELSMLGVTRPVKLVSEMFNCGTHPMLKKKMCGGEFVARIKRSDWNMKYAIPAVADDVVLRINVEAFKD